MHLVSPRALPGSAGREHAIKTAARVWRAGMDSLDAMPVSDAARACHYPGGPSLVELERAIRNDRAARSPRAPQQQAA